MSKFDIKRTSRKCSTSGRTFEPSEEFYSALIEDEDANFIREDFSSEVWTDEPEGCIGWWKSRMPDNRGGRVYWAPTPVLLSYFQALLEKPGSRDIAYVMSIVLIRNRTLKMIDTESENGVEIMNCYHRPTKTTYQVPVLDIPQQRVQEIQDELADQLFTDYREDDSGSETDGQQPESGP
ncbi:MAG: hypothetical protein AAF456_01810 [Planctomycetota bacterium]